ncbi:MAG: 1-acyl-sn-glycerol-3-phosphate acyltransferase [Xanthomonadales bacterium]|nr:1-acyl-sn-glycerol-3-phosphate acyltransferase [Xanthomonadales bacterium]
MEDRRGKAIGSDGHSSRVARLDESQLLEQPGFQSELQALALRLGRDMDSTREYASRCLEELAVRPDERYLNWSARLARFMVTRSYEPEIDVNRERLEDLKKLAGERPLVFLWSHKSHLDSFVFLRTLFEADFRPQPLSFAGINMRFAGFGTLAKRSGAIFLRRSFRDDDVYKLVFRHYIDFLVQQRVPLSWSIEGTRSRTGKLMPPKLGLIQWVVDSYRRASCEDALLVPVAISFDQIPEMDDYVAMQRGLPKRKESLRWFVQYIRGMRTPHGRIYVRFAEPVALSDSVEVSPTLTASGQAGEPDRIQVRKLAFAVSSRIEHAKPITATDLITLVLLDANGRGLDGGQIQAHAGQILDLVRHRQLPMAGDLARIFAGGKAPEPAPALEATLAAMTRTRVLSCFERGVRPVYNIPSGRQLAAAYYRNTVVHYFLSSALAELALAAHHPGDDARAFWRTAMALRDLLKFEFFFKTREQYRRDISDFLGYRYPDWSSTMGEVFSTRPPLFGQGILRSFVETYWILARVLDLAREATRDEQDLIQQCLGQGEEMRLRRLIHCEASGPLLSNAVRLAAHRELLAGTDLAGRRAAFAEEMDLALDALNGLQHRYDRDWQACAS